MEPPGSLPCSQELATSPCREADESRVGPPVVFKIRFNIILPYFSFGFPYQNHLCMFAVPCILHLRTNDKRIRWSIRYTLGKESVTIYISQSDKYSIIDYQMSLTRRAYNNKHVLKLQTAHITRWWDFGNDFVLMTFQSRGKCIRINNCSY
jgi:hypothetical protein